MTSRKWEPPRPSAYTPFFRRFTDERARELRETIELYDKVGEQFAASPWSGDLVFATCLRVIYDNIKQDVDVPEALDGSLLMLLKDMLCLEPEIFELPEIDFDEPLTLDEAVELRRFLRKKERFLAHDDRLIGLLANTLEAIACGLIEDTPPLGKESPFSAPLIHLLPHTSVVDKTVGTLSKLIDEGLCEAINTRIYENACAYNGFVPFTEHKRPFKQIADLDLGPMELVETYLGGTPFQEFFETRVPLGVTQETHFSHMHVVGGSGAGKTQWLQSLILHHLESDASIVVVDSQGDLISKLSRLAVSKDRNFVLISPRDIRHPPAINIFDVHLERFDEAMREQVTAGVIETFDYLFAGLLGADLTAKQGVFFRMIARLLLQLPETLGRNATILDMLRLMDDHTPYLKAIAALPPIPRSFFENDFPGRTFNQTREQIKYRLNAILENPTLARLFTSEETKVDLFEELNKGSVILIDTSKEFLKGASSHFGRIFISLILQAVLERASIPEDKRHPAFLIVDEAAEYFDQNIDDLLTEARKYKLGCVFAHQFLDQCTPQLRASLAANTSIKLAGSVSTHDARTLAPDFRTTADFILSQPRLSFACHIRGLTQTAISLPVEAGLLEQQDRLTDEEFEHWQIMNRNRVSFGPSKREASDNGKAADDSAASADDHASEDAAQSGHSAVDDDDITPQPWG